MSASSTSSVRVLEERAEVKGSADAIWLARKEVRRTWVSFVLTGLFFLFLGFFVVPSVSGVFELEGFGAGGRRIEGFYNALGRSWPPSSAPPTSWPSAATTPWHASTT